MDAPRTLAEATRRYLATDISLAELWDIGCALDDELLQLPVDHLERQLMAAIVQGITWMDDGLRTESDLREVLQTELEPGSDAEWLNIANPIAPTQFTQIASLIIRSAPTTFVVADSVESTYQYAYGN